MSKSILARTAAAVVVAALLGAAAYAEFGERSQNQAQAATAASAPVPVAGPRTLPDFSAIVAAQGPAVVNISVSGSVKTGVDVPDFPQLDPGDPFYDFFRHFRIPVPRGDVPTHGLGSGFIISPDGLILTNAHVVSGAEKVTVKLTDKREFQAKVLGIDKETDVAVLRIEASGLPTVAIGDPARTRVGDWVLAIGSPFGFDNSATAGIVSAKSRSLPEENYVPFIQTDVAVNPGNSGGPLFDAGGQVIGINSQIYSRTGGYEGLSFAIPIDVAMKVEQQIVAHGKVERGRMGVTVQDVNQALADAFGLKKPEGALVSSVEAGGPGARAGLEAGDVILEFDGKAVDRSSDLPPLVGATKPGTSVQLKIWRKGATRELTARVGEFKDEKVAHGDGGGTPSKTRLGVAVRPLTPEERRQADVGGGVLVEQSGGAAARAGIQPGDVILSINGEPVKSVEELRALVAKAGKHVALLVQRDNAKIFIPVDLG